MYIEFVAQVSEFVIRTNWYSEDLHRMSGCGSWLMYLEFVTHFIWETRRSGLCAKWNVWIWFMAHVSRVRDWFHSWLTEAASVPPSGMSWCWCLYLRFMTHGSRVRDWFHSWLIGAASVPIGMSWCCCLALVRCPHCWHWTSGIYTYKCIFTNKGVRVFVCVCVCVCVCLCVFVCCFCVC